MVLMVVTSSYNLHLGMEMKTTESIQNTENQYENE